MIIRKASVDFCVMDAGGIKGQRTRQLLNELVNDGMLGAIILMIAESKPEEKDVLVKLIMNLLKL
mgnify:CR=1 FL=1